MKKNIFVVSFVLSLSLCACNASNSSSDIYSSSNEPISSSSISSSDSKEEIKKEYIDKDINIIREMNEKKEGEEKATPTVDKTIGLRFYNESPNIPYVKVSKYFQEFFKTNLNRENNNHIYKYSLENGNYISFDAENDLFSSYGLRSFNNHPDAKENVGKLFVKEISLDKTTPSTRVISLKNYDIDIKEGESEAYVPFSFLSKLAGGYSLYNAQYNGKDIYVIDYGARIGDFERTTTYYGDTYYEVLDDFKNERPSDLIKYNYNELCFVFDNLRGYTSQLVFGDNNLLTLGLNGLLERYYPKMKEYLLSSNKEDYYWGMGLLFQGLFDGGHTIPLNQSPNYSAATQGITQDDDFYDLNRAYMNRLMEKTLAGVYFQRSKISLLSEVGYTSETPNYYLYDEASKTAVIGFDSFETDYVGWDNFYKGKGEVPVNTDSYAFIRSKFYQAKEDGANNLVLDLTTNGGGDSSALNGIVGLLNEAEAHFESNDIFNKYRSTENYLVDINLDGEYDQLDKEELEQFDFNVGILTSNQAFSCGNLLPSTLKGLGFKTIGEKTGGGSCAIIMESTADGFPYVHSSYLCLSDANGNNIDEGVPVDYQIERTYPNPAVPVIFNCDAFYDFATIGVYLDTAYQI